MNRRYPNFIDSFWDSAKAIRELAESGVKQSVIAEMFGACRASICLVVNGKQWVSHG